MQTEAIMFFNNCEYDLALEKFGEKISILDIIDPKKNSEEYLKTEKSIALVKKKIQSNNLLLKKNKYNKTSIF